MATGHGGLASIRGVEVLIHLQQGKGWNVFYFNFCFPEVKLKSYQLREGLTEQM